MENAADNATLLRYVKLIEQVRQSTAAKQLSLGNSDPLKQLRAERSVLDVIVAAQQPSGTFLAPSPNVHPETWWFDELVFLHAVTSYAIASQNLAAMTAVHRAAAYHVNETQPDHATTDPWAVHAFVLHKDANMLADQELHTVQTGSPTAVTLMLLDDSLYCLRLLIARSE
jgi:hypothetical protein